MGLRLVRQVLLFIACWFILYFMSFGVHEQFHAWVLSLFGVKSVVVHFFWCGIPYMAVTVAVIPQGLEWIVGLVGFAGGAGVAALYAFLDRFVPGIHQCRPLDLALNYHVGQQATYSVFELLWITGIINPLIFQMGIVLSWLVGILLTLLELAGYINI